MTRYFSALILLLVLTTGIKLSAQETRKGVMQSILGYITDTSTRHKVKYKTLTVMKYSSSDSTLDNKRPEMKTVSFYNTAGLLDSLVTYDTLGNFTSRYIKKYDAANHLIQTTDYDTAGITDDRRFTYDAAGNTVEAKITEPVKKYDDYDEDGDVKPDTAKTPFVRKYNTFIISTHFDVEGNLVSMSIDSMGTILSTGNCKYDSKNRLVAEYFYRKGVLYLSDAIVFDNKGNYTYTGEQYANESGNTCHPDHHKVVEKYDAKDYILSSYTNVVYNGDTTINDIKYAYKYSGKQIVLRTKTTKETSAGFTSESSETTSYKYDKNGNEIERTSKGGGAYGRSSTFTYSYNDKNNVLQTQSFGSCLDKPTYTVNYTYYGDGETLKEITEKSDYSNSVDKYDEHGNITEEVSLGKYSSSQTAYTYTY
ncbi:MAG TPA: hypothetical protein VK890_10295 [Bacteroidia bacterium]|jgi:YD repeat-containing protein|nr:hypothetical protein [Bacteroidia bacterium]